MARETCCSKLVDFILTWILGPLSTPLVALAALFYRPYDAWTFEWFQSRHMSSPAEHRKKVAGVQEQVKKWHADGRKTRMCTAKPYWNSYSLHGINKRSLAQIDVSALNSVVEVDTINRVVTVEPGVMMGQLTTILISRGWTIPVVPEFETLTVGGVICGTGIESNSTRYGLSSDTALEYEIVLSNGNVVTCSKDENADLFYSIPWSHGTLGFLTAVTMPLIPAEKYVELEYHPTDSLAEAQRLLDSPDFQFVEGIAYARNKYVVTRGNMSDRPDPKRGPVNHINRWYKQFFYKNVENFAGKRPRGEDDPYVEFYPLRDYYHRHTRATFWGMTIPFPYTNNRLYLLLFGGVFPGNPKLARRAMSVFGQAIEQLFLKMLNRDNMVQDFIVPLKHLEPMLDLTHETVEIYPLWLCPCKFFRNPGMVHCSGDSESEMYVDVGIYGRVAPKKRADFQVERTTRKFEAFCLEYGGVQFLYADSFLSRDEFRRMFDMSLYDEVRVKYDCLDAFPDVYDKVSKHARQIQV